MRTAFSATLLLSLAATSTAQEQVVAWSVIDSVAGQQPNIFASATPFLGQLYPLTANLNVDGFGNVGMGTTSPASALHVFGENFGASFKAFDFQGGAATQLVAGLETTSGEGPQMRFSGAGGSFMDIGQDGSGSFVIEGADVPHLRVTNNGRIAASLPAFNNVRFGAASDFNFTIYGANDLTDDTFTCGVFGDITAAAPGAFGAAVYGRSIDATRAAVFAEGDSGATGTKSFIQPHPTDASKEIRFVCLEGNESGTYFRGKTTLQNGIATIEVPQDFRMVSEAENLTVQLTPIGSARVWVQSYDLNRVVLGGTGDIEVHYMVNGVRRGYGDLETIRRNQSYVPRSAGEFGTQYPQAVRDILVENGTLNPDYTPNLQTASRLGWKLNIDPQVDAVPTQR